MTVDNTFYYGQTDPSTAQGEWNQLRFVIQQQILSIATSMPVKVTAVQAGGLGPVGFVTIQVLVDQVTGNDKTVSHGEITNVPYVRIQGGANAVIIDPQVGDIGIACFASRDISAVKSARAIAPPGSRRAYDFSDAVYLGGMLNGTPTQYIQFTEGGILVHSANQVSIGDTAATVRKLVDERMVAFFNAHTHPALNTPPTQVMGASQLTDKTRAN